MKRTSIKILQHANCDHPLSSNFQISSSMPISLSELEQNFIKSLFLLKKMTPESLNLTQDRKEIGKVIDYPA